MAHYAEDEEKALENSSDDRRKNNIQAEAVCTAGSASAEQCENSLSEGGREVPSEKSTAEQAAADLTNSPETQTTTPRGLPGETTTALDEVHEAGRHTFISPAVGEDSVSIGFIRALTITDFKSYSGTLTVDPLFRFMSVVGPNASGKSNLLDALLFVLGADHKQLRLRSSLAELVAPGAQSAAVRMDLCNGSSVYRTVSLASGDELVVNGKKACFRSSSDYCKALEQASPLLGHVRNFVLTQSAAVSLPNINFLAIIENSASDNSLEARKEYSAAERASRAASQRLCECIAEKRRAQLAERSVQADIAARDEFIRLSEEKDRLESSIRLAELQELRSKLDEIREKENTLMTCSAGDRALYESKHTSVLSLRREAAVLQREFFEREARCVRRAAYHSDSKQHPALSHAVELEQSRREVEEARALVQRIETELSKLSPTAPSSNKSENETRNGKTGDGWNSPGMMVGKNDDGSIIAKSITREEAAGDDVEELERILSESTREEREKLSKLVMENYDAVARRRELQARLRELRARRSHMKREALGETERRAAEQSKRRALEEELERLRSRADLAEAGRRLEEIVEEEKRKKAEMAEVVRSILMSRGKKSDSVKRAAEGVLVNNVLSKMFAGVYGRVVDLIKPASARYAAAFAVAVSPFESCVVVESSSVALECVRYLREAKAGRLSFVVLSRIPQGNGQDNKTSCTADRARGNEEESGGTGRGVSAVKLEQCLVAEPRFWKVVKMVSGQAVVVEDAKTARAAIREGHIRRAITIGGVSITSDGIVSRSRRGDERGQSTSLEALLERRTQLVSDLRTLAARRSAFSELEIVLDRMAETEAELAPKTEQPADKKIATTGGVCESDLEVTEAEIRSTEEKLCEIERELAEFSAAEARLRAAIGAKEREILCSSLKAAGVATLAELRRKKMLETRLFAARESLCRAAEKLRMLEVSGAAAFSGSGDKDYQDTEEDAIKKLEARLCAIRARLKAESNELEKLSEARSVAEKEILECRLERVRIEEDIRALSSVLSASQDGTSAREDTKAVSELRYELSEVSNRLAELCSAVGIGGTSGNARELSQRVAEAEAALEAAKAVADSARERFVAVKRARMARFSELFDSVSRYIGEIYCSLVESPSEDSLPGFSSSARPFSRAQLLCEGDPFEGGIKYFVVPPGKSFTEFNDLSGGERIMAYMAFLLALGKSIRVPLFVLDEVDAALDRVHVERLSRYIANSALWAQFIVVSLKPQFFRHSDALIGVYRPANRVNSSILTLRLK